jgi:hypothetical protein
MIKALALVTMFLAACGGGGGSGDADDAEHAYILGSLVFGPEDSTSYVSVLDSLEPQTVDASQARSFPGSADVWVHGGAVFVADSEALTITKYSVEGHTLVEHEVIGFSNYGLTDFGFWVNTFVADDKAYLLNGASEYVVWNPTTMVITGTIALPVLPARDGLKQMAGYADRATLVRGGRLYQPLYWTDDSYFTYTPDSAIVVIDVASDAVVEVLEAPCPGLDYGSADAAGNLYFSSWVYAPGAAAVRAQPATCVFEVPADGSAPHVAVRIADIAGGREGGALRFLTGGRAMFSVFHDERFTIEEDTDVAEVTFGPNWRFWSFDATAAGPFGSGAAEIDAIDWSAGAQYTFDIADRDYMLVASGDYSTTAIYQLEGSTPTPVFDVDGWSFRLFQLR